MHDPVLLDTFLKFGLAALLGFVLGLERGMTTNGQTQRGLRDFVLVSLLGAVSAFAAERFDSFWIVVTGFVGVLALLLFGVWVSYAPDQTHQKGITTEIAALLTFFLGVLVVHGQTTLAIALTIVILAVLTEKEALHELQRRVQKFELEAALKLLVITFVVLPLLPNEPLSRYLVLPLGEVTEVRVATGDVTVALSQGRRFEPGQELLLYDDAGRRLGMVQVTEADGERVTTRCLEPLAERLPSGSMVRAELDLPLVTPMLAAIVPYKVWLIVVLVSAISFVGYVLVKLLGTRAGSGVTGLVGGLASSTVTTLSFARRSLETPAANRHFAVAVILASSVMFPRLLFQIGLVNQALMRHLVVPIGAMGLAGLLAAGFCFWRCSLAAASSDTLRLANPFRLAAAFKFTAVFAVTLMVTHLAIAHLSHAWLPVISFISGLPDADAVAFSMSHAERTGLISANWAGFNVVLGALANTLMKLLLVLMLGHRGLLKHVAWAFLLISVTGIATACVCFHPGWTPGM